MLLSLSDFIILPLYVFVIYLLARNIKNRNIEKSPEYQYFVSGLMFKIFGGICIVLIYTLYYDGGDTTAYFESGLILDNLRKENFYGYLTIMMNNLSRENFFFFNADTGFPQYYFDPQSFAVVRLSSLLNFISFKRYLISTILLATISYSGLWKLYQLFCELYPGLRKVLAYSVLYVPSVVFWGSGILKDTYTMMGACWFTFSFYKVLIKREGIFRYTITGFLGAYLIIQMKPYIFLALLPGSLLWFSFVRLRNISNPFARFISGPFIFAAVAFIGYYSFGSLGSSLGQYSSLDKIVNKAIITQQDLKMEYNKGNTFDIGEFDGSIGSIIRKFPIATFAGLFYPQMWQVRNPVMLIAALENTYLIGLTLLLLFRLGPRLVFKLISGQPLLTFSIVFAIFFSFSVGLTTSNFGALVRYKIPAVPFYLSALLILYNEQKITEEEIEILREGGRLKTA